MRSPRVHLYIHYIAPRAAQQSSASSRLSVAVHNTLYSSVSDWNHSNKTLDDVRHSVFDFTKALDFPLKSHAIITDYFHGADICWQPTHPQANPSRVHRGLAYNSALLEKHSATRMSLPPGVR